MFNFQRKFETKSYQVKVPIPMSEMIEDISKNEEATYNSTFIALLEYALSAYNKEDND